MNNWITESMIAGMEGCIFIQHVWMWGKHNKPQESILLPLFQKRSLNEELRGPLVRDCFLCIHFSMDLCSPPPLAWILKKKIYHYSKLCFTLMSHWRWFGQWASHCFYVVFIATIKKGGRIAASHIQSIVWGVTHAECFCSPDCCWFKYSVRSEKSKENGKEK